jgi:hypothetical protein
MRLIDMECNVPKRGGGEAEAASAPVPGAAAAAERPAGYGMANYGRIFRSRREGSDPRPDTALAEYVAMMQRLGIVRAVPFGVTNDEVAELLAQYPDRFIGLARISGLLGMQGVRELEFRVREQRGSGSRRWWTASRPATGASTPCTPRPASSTSPCGSTRR